jgi:hypothetical protein
MVVSLWKQLTNAPEICIACAAMCSDHVVPFFQEEAQKKRSVLPGYSGYQRGRQIRPPLNSQFRPETNVGGLSPYGIRTESSQSRKTAV